MRNFVAVLLISSLLCNSAAVAAGARAGFGWVKKPREMLRGFGGDKLAELSGKVKQLGAGLLLAGFVTCNMMACTADEAARSLSQAESRVATIAAHDRSVSLDEIIASLEQIEGAQIGVIKHAEQDLLTIETDDGTVYLQLSEGGVLINNSESALKVTLSEEAVDAGLIAEGSRIAIVPAIALAGGLLILTGWATLAAYGDPPWEIATAAGIGLFSSATMGLGTYHLLVLL